MGVMQAQCGSHIHFIYLLTCNQKTAEHLISLIYQFQSVQNSVWQNSGTAHVSYQIQVERDTQLFLLVFVLCAKMVE